MSKIRYCLTGCKRRDGDKSIHVQAEPPSKLCTRCEDNLHDWLKKIPDLYALLPTFIEHGVAEKNPDSVTTKAAEAPAPMRLEIIDLLDTRLGRKWLGMFPAHDRRGVAGTLQVHVERLIEERNLTTPHDHRNVAAACSLLNWHRLWIAEQDWVSFLLDDVKQLHRQLSDAVGEYRRPPVGRCHVIPEGAEEPCKGPLHASTYGGVRCGKCGATWDANHLRQLGLAQAGQETA